MTAISREALAVIPPANCRRYRSAKRQNGAEQKRTALIDAVLGLIAKGHFRATAQQLADLAGVRRQAICRYFGSVDLLYRVVAREHWQRVPLPLITDGGRDAVWLVLVGQPRELP